MNITLLGATGSLGSECLKQAVNAGHQITVLVRDANKLAAPMRELVTVIEGNALNPADLARSITAQTEAILFAVGVDKQSPENLCTDITRHLISIMEQSEKLRLVWCGGGSTFVAEDQITFGARIVEKIAQWFMPLKHYDKEHQYQLLLQNPQLNWQGIRPLQMKKGSLKRQYRLGFDQFSGMSSISFADCAHAMLAMLNGDQWLQKAPIIQY